jgi:hypothetical protein
MVSGLSPDYPRQREGIEIVIKRDHINTSLAGTTTIIVIDRRTDIQIKYIFVYGTL